MSLIPRFPCRNMFIDRRFAVADGNAVVIPKVILVSFCGEHPAFLPATTLSGGVLTMSASRGTKQPPTTVSHLASGAGSIGFVVKKLSYHLPCLPLLLPFAPFPSELWCCHEQLPASCLAQCPVLKYVLQSPCFHPAVDASASVLVTFVTVARVFLAAKNLLTISYNSS